MSYRISKTPRWVFHCDGCGAEQEELGVYEDGDEMRWDGTDRHACGECLEGREPRESRRVSVMTPEAMDPFHGASRRIRCQVTESRMVELNLLDSGELAVVQYEGAKSDPTSGRVMFDTDRHLYAAIFLPAGMIENLRAMLSAIP